MEFLRCNWKNSVIVVFKRGGKMKKMMFVYAKEYSKAGET